MTNNYSQLGAVIPVREDSTRVKDKVVLPFTQNLNLLEWKIDQLKEVLPPENIFVSTDSERLQQIARDRGVRIHSRAPQLCQGSALPFSDVITGIVQDIPFPHIAWVTVVVPLMSPADYRSGFDAYLEHVVHTSQYDSLVSVNLFKEYLWSANGPLNYSADRNHTISQQLPDLYRVTNGLYMMRKEEILQRRYFLGSSPFFHQVGRMAGIDIDEWEDYEFSLALLQLYRQKETDLT